MFIKDLLSIYPDATLRNTELNDSDYISIEISNQYLVIPTGKLSKTEKLILKKLKDESSKRSVWYHYLINDGQKPLASLSRIIHFKTKGVHDADLYLETLSGLFESTLDRFFKDEESGYLVIDDTTVDHDLIEAQLNIIDEDFGTKTQLFVGALLPVDSSFKKCFEEEVLLFKSTTSKVSTYTTTFMKHHFSEIVNRSPLAQTIQASISKIEDGDKVIESLWKNHGNLSKTAQDLYIHRNTLNYRLDKFYEDTQLNLRVLSDLVLCYWITNSN